MTEDIASTPGWVEERLDELFAALPPSAEVRGAQTGYLTCLAGLKAPAAPSDNLGAEFEACRPVLHRALMAAGIDAEAWTVLSEKLEKLEAEFAEES